VTELVANPRNPNKHSDKQVALLAKIIRHQGWRSPITVSNRSGFVVTGHGRLQAAILLGEQLVPVDRQDFASEADEWAHLVADTRSAELADADKSMIADLLKDLDSGGLDMDLTGFDMEALEELMKPPVQPDAPEDFQAVDENIETEHQCPKCGYQWSGGKMVEAEEEQDGSNS
jgi:ParB-like chromosome segregation protein Spo0J